MKAKRKRKRTRRGKEVKRRGMGIVIRREIAGKGKGRQLDFRKREEDERGSEGNREHRTQVKRKERKGNEETRREVRK